MNIVIIAHERSLNKAEGLLQAYSNQNIILVLDYLPKKDTKTYIRYAKQIVVNKYYNIVAIAKEIQSCDKVYCVSENLLPVQSQLESYFGIDNLSAFAAEILSNKQMFDDFCRNIGVGNYVPKSITPTFHSQLDIFKSAELFTKPDIGTGSNVFILDSDQNVPNIEYRRWNNKHHLLKCLKDKNSHNEFFDFNKHGIHIERFNYKTCKIMVQEYHWSEEPSLIPIGYVKDGIVNTICYLKTTKVKYGDVLNPSLTPVELHSNSKQSDIAKDLAVWIVSTDEVNKEKNDSMQYFLQTVVDNLNIKDLFFAGPDFHISNGKLIAIDFNPRPGQFMNILNNVNNGDIFSNIIENKPIQIKNKLLWGCAMLTPGKINKLQNVESLQNYFNAQNTELSEGMIIPEFQNLQNKNFNVNLNITGSNEQELFERYKTINQLLQKCITY